VITGASGAAETVYKRLIAARETDVRLVVINGLKRYGIPALMGSVDGQTESVKVGGVTRVLNLENPPGSQFPDVTYTDAKAKLTEARAKLPAWAKAKETGSTHPMAKAFAKIGGPAAAVAAAGGFALELADLVEPPSPVTIPPVSKKMAAAMLAAKAKPLSE